MYAAEKIKAGTWFIDLDKDYDELQLISCGDDPKTHKLSVMWSNFPKEPTIMEVSDFKGTPFPDLNGPWTELYDRFSELKPIYTKSINTLTKVIYGAQYKKISVEEIINIYTKDGSVNEDEAKALLKLSIAKGFFNFERQKGGDFVKLSRHFLEHENQKRFFQAIADEVITKSERIELLIQHSTTKGNYREELLRGVIRKYLPKKYEVATGFIEGCKRQCDILIYDSHNFSPLFREGDVVVIPEKSVRAVIEVKSTLDSGQLTEAIELLSEVARHRNTPAPIFKGIFAFKKGLQEEKSIAEAIGNFYHSYDSSGVITHDILYLFETINSICVLNEQCLITDVIDYTFADNTIRPRFYSVQPVNKELKPYCALFFNELFSFLDVERYAKKVNVDYFKSLEYEISFDLEYELYDKKWKPRSSFQNEHKFEEDSIRERVNDVINWKIGNYSAQDLEQKYFPNTFSPIDIKQSFDFKIK